MNYLGEDGYMKITGEVMKTVRHIQAGINLTPGIKVLSDPEMSVFAIGSNGSPDNLDVYEIADELSLRGWHLDRQHYPPSLHMTINYSHITVADEFLSDLADCTKIVHKPGLRKTATRILLNTAQMLANILPERWVSSLMAKVSSFLGTSGAGLPARMAPIYGLIGTLPNRGDLKELVLDLLDSMTRN